MFFVLVLLAGAVMTQAGVIYHPSANYGLRYPVASSRGVGPAGIRSLVSYPEAINQNIPRGLISYPGFPAALNPTLSYHGPIGKYAIASTRVHSVTPPRVLPLFNPLSNNEVQSPITTAHVSTPVWLSPALNNRPLGPALVSSPVVLNPSHNSHVAVGASYTTSHDEPSVFFRPSLNQPAIRPAFKSPHNLPLVPHPESISYGAVVATTNCQLVRQTPVITADKPDKTVSYSLSGSDYEYLKRHKIEGKDSPFNPAYHTASPVQQYKNTHAQHDSDLGSLSKRDNVLNQRSGIASGEDLTAAKISSDEDLLKRSSEYDIYHTGTEYNRPSFGVIQPIVTKHISFHVPPPDFEEPPATPVILPPRKKNYNILFIKTPSQERQTYAYLQQLLQSRQPQAEEKTLIYVLAKTSDPPQQEVLLPPEPKVSSPEVYFIKYKTKLGAISETSDGLVSDLLDNTSSYLERKRSVMESCPEEPLKEKI